MLDRISMAYTSASTSRNREKTFNRLYTSSQVPGATKKPASSERLGRTLLTQRPWLASFSERKARPSEAHLQATGRGVPKASRQASRGKLQTIGPTRYSSTSQACCAPRGTRGGDGE